MEFIAALVVVIGLVVFEVVASIDNAIINADILSTMREWARRWFLLWGIIIAVFVVRGLLPWMIIWLSTPSLGPIEALTATFSGDGTAAAAIAKSAPYLLLAGGIFMVNLFLHWLMCEKKNCIVPGEGICSKLGHSFYAVSSLILLAIIWMVYSIDPFLCVAAAGGSLLYFIMQAFRLYADAKSVELAGSCAADNKKSDLSKLMLLEVIDASFSIDGVIGAFAFTLSVPLILIGNGIGAIVVRELTVRNIENIKKYAYLKNGAMYSIGFLGLIMCMEGFGLELPVYLTPILTIIIISVFLMLSIKKIKKDGLSQCTE